MTETLPEERLAATASAEDTEQTELQGHPTADSIASLHVVRTLRTYLSTRYGVGLAMVSKAGQVWWLDSTPGDSAPTAERLLRTLVNHPKSRDAHVNSMLTMATGRTGRVMSHAFGVRSTVAPCRVAGAAGRLVAWPLFTKEDQRSVAVGTLVDFGIVPRHAERFTAEVPLIDKHELASISDLVAILAAEINQYVADFERSTQELVELRSKGRSRYSKIIGRSRPMLRLYRLMDRVVRADSTVYIRGENGTGKELVAAEIHNHSRRAGRPFVVQNCSALNDSLLESELFGHRRGAFTGAVNDKPGLFESANTGTFFLDEIGDMSQALQVKLLRVLQDGTFTPVGSTTVKKVDVRMLCATNRDLQAMVQAGTFREDLFYRINVITLAVPPLRERKDDIVPLANYFLKQAQHALGNLHSHKRFTQSALDLLKKYHWPGNVRELENEVERVVVMSGALVTEIGQDMLSPHIRMHPLLAPQQHSPGLLLPQALERLERTMIFDELVTQGWNKTRAAKALGISRRNLIRKCMTYGFDKDDVER